MYKKALLVVLSCYFFMGPLHAMEGMNRESDLYITKNAMLSLFNLLTKPTGDTNIPTLIPSSFKDKRIWLRKAHSDMVLSFSLEDCDNNQVAYHPSLFSYPTVGEIVKYLKIILKRKQVSSEYHVDRNAKEYIIHENIIEMYKNHAGKYVEQVYTAQEVAEIGQVIKNDQMKKCEGEKELLKTLLTGDFSIEVKFKYPEAIKSSRNEKTKLLVVKLSTEENSANTPKDAEEFPEEFNEIMLSLINALSGMFADKACTISIKLDRTPFGMFG